MLRRTLLVVTVVGLSAATVLYCHGSHGAWSYYWDSSAHNASAGSLRAVAARCSDGGAERNRWADEFLADVVVGVVTSAASRARLGAQLAAWASRRRRGNLTVV